MRIRLFSMTATALLSLCLFFSLLIVPTQAEPGGETPPLASPAATVTNQPGPTVNPTSSPYLKKELSAKAAVVVDDATGRIVFAKNPNGRRAPASITKIMTAIVALRYDSPDRLIRAAVDWWDLQDSTLMGLNRTHRVAIDDLLYGLMLPSGNDATIAIARTVAGSESRFVDLMNLQAKELGLQNTQYNNPHGLDAEGHYTSAANMAVIARFAMQDPTFRKVVSARSHDVSTGGPLSVRNINRFTLNYPDGDGVKNGYTGDAGQTIVATAVRGGKRGYVVLLGSTDYSGEVAFLLDAFFADQSPVPADAPMLPSPANSRPDDGQIPSHPIFDLPPGRTGFVPPSLRAQ